MFSSFDLDELRMKVKAHLSEHRYNHTLGVEASVINLGSIFLPDNISELRAAALLHDITKEMPVDFQIELLNAFDIQLSREDMAAIPALHSFSAVPFIKNNFPDYATNDVLSAVYNHTLGRADISLFDKIIFLADFIEDGRTYSGCVKTAMFVKDNISKEKTFESNLLYLNQALIFAIECTMLSLSEKKVNPHPRTVAMKYRLYEETKKVKDVYGKQN